MRGDWSTTWRYAIDDRSLVDGGVKLDSRLRLSGFKDIDSGYRQGGRFEDLESGCEQTLARIKVAAERS